MLRHFPEQPLKLTIAVFAMTKLLETLLDCTSNIFLCLLEWSVLYGTCIIIIITIIIIIITILRFVMRIPQRLCIDKPKIFEGPQAN